MSDDMDNARSRRRALVALLITIAIGLGAWYFVGRAAESGIARMERLDAARVQCDALLARARTREDTVRVSHVALTDTIDPRSNDAIRRCGDLGEVR